MERISRPFISAGYKVGALEKTRLNKFSKGFYNGARSDGR